MIYLKSIGAGLVGLIVVPIFLIGCLMVGMVVHTWLHPTQTEGSVGWDPISLWRMNPIVWLIPVLIFLAAFVWEYRRAAR